MDIKKGNWNNFYWFVQSESPSRKIVRNDLLIDWYNNEENTKRDRGSRKSLEEKFRSGVNPIKDIESLKKSKIFLNSLTVCITSNFCTVMIKIEVKARLHFPFTHAFTALRCVFLLLTLVC